MYCKLPEILQRRVKSAFFCQRLGNYIFLYFYHSSANFLSPFISPRAFFVHTKIAFIFHSTVYVYLLSKLGKVWPTAKSFGHRGLFPPLNYGLMVPVGDLMPWEQLSVPGPQYVCILLRLPLSVPVLNLSQGIQRIYLLTTFFTCQSLYYFFSFCLTNIPPMS